MFGGGIRKAMEADIHRGRGHPTVEKETTRCFIRGIVSQHSDYHGVHSILADKTVHGKVSRLGGHRGQKARYTSSLLAGSKTMGELFSLPGCPS